MHSIIARTRRDNSSGCSGGEAHGIFEFLDVGIAPSDGWLPRLALRGQFHQPRQVDLRWERTTQSDPLDTGESMLGMAFASARGLHPPRLNRAAIALICLLSAADKTIRARYTSLMHVSLE